jgi:CubicO group peptidase (beta-lactamase class C family)
MPRRSRWAIVLVLLPFPLRAQQPSLGALDGYVRQALQDWRAPGIAFAVVRNDSVVLARGYGVRELGQPDPVTPNTLFAIGSTTKAFTTASLAMLVDEGKVSWDDKVTKHLPGFQLYDPYVTREITIRDLLTHRSGLARGDRLWSSSGMSRAEVLRRVRFLAPSWGFRSTYGYQNIMFLAAGTVVEAASGMSWDDFVRTRIFIPLGMRRTVTSVTALANLGDVATPHEKLDGAPHPVEWANIDNIGPAGSINSSVSDMARWIRLQLGDGTFEGRQLVSRAALEETHTPQMVERISEEDRKLMPESHLLSYGLGWAIRDYRGFAVVSHGGAIRGMRAMVALVPERNLGVVVLTNVAESYLPVALSYRLIDLYTGGPGKDWSALYLARTQAAEERARAERKKIEAARVMGTSPSLALERYAGTYADSMYGEIKITKEAEGLVARFGPFYTGDLRHWNFDTFEVVWRNPVFRPSFVTFTLDPAGHPRTLEYQNLGSFGRERDAPNR